MAEQEKIKLPDDLSITGIVGIGENIEGVGFCIKVILDIYLPSLQSILKESLVEKAHLVCPYSNATRGNVDVQLNIL